MSVQDARARIPEGSSQTAAFEKVTLTSRGRELIVRYGYNFRTVYRPIRHISRKRLTRLLAIYQDIVSHGEIEERIYRRTDCTRQTLLRDLHLLESLGLISCTLDFGAEKASFADCLIRK